MAYERYDLWTHGTSVQVEYPERVKYIRRAVGGTVIRQELGTWNWFHFEIPKPTIKNDPRVYIRYEKFWLKATTGNRMLHIDVREAYISEIQVWDGPHHHPSASHLWPSTPSPGTNCGDIDIEKRITVDDTESEQTYGLLISLKVEFQPLEEPPPTEPLSDRLTLKPKSNLGEITFIRAGVHHEVTI